MPSINEIMAVAEPVIQEKVAEAVLAERLHTLAEIKRYASRACSAESVVWWCGLNEDLIRAVQAQEGEPA